MSEKPVKYKPNRLGTVNRKSLTVRLGLMKENFDAIEEWVRAYRELDDPTMKIQALNEVFKYIYPKLKETEISSQDILDMEAEDVSLLKPADLDDDKLLKELEKQK